MEGNEVNDLKRPRPKLLALVVSGVVFAPIACAMSVSSASAESSTAPIALSGTVAGVSDLIEGSVKVQLEPDQELIEAFTGAMSVQNSGLPASLVETSGNSYTVRIDPAALPPEVISDTGIVTFDVFAQDPDAARYTATTVSVRAVLNDDGTYSWTDPTGPSVDLDDGELAARIPASARTAYRRSLVPGASLVTKFAPRVRPVHANLAKPQAKGVICDSVGCAPTQHASGMHRMTVAEDDGGETEPSGAIDAPVITDGATAAADCGDVDGDGMWWTDVKRNVSSTIGTAYPVRDDPAWMSHESGSSSEFTSTFGIAWDNLGYFEESGTRTAEKGTGFDWDHKSYSRSFRVGVVYQKVEALFDRCPGATPYYTKWVPIGYSGGYNENTDGVSRPDWNHCVTIGSTGTWWRDASSGSSYSLSTGVKFAGVIGVDLSSKRAYNAEAKLGYHVGLVGRRMCGNDDVPGMSGKVMERSKP
ncbi:MAG: hypothetical protein JWN91_739 [Nocardioides sp.]|jgi:hypothetical protein|nr:hypothetical protein [Nocardioides sp.]